MLHFFLNPADKVGKETGMKTTPIFHSFFGILLLLSHLNASAALDVSTVPTLCEPRGFGGKVTQTPPETIKEKFNKKQTDEFFEPLNAYYKEMSKVHEEQKAKLNLSVEKRANYLAIVKAATLNVCGSKSMSAAAAEDIFKKLILSKKDFNQCESIDQALAENQKGLDYYTNLVNQINEMEKSRKNGETDKPRLMPKAAYVEGKAINESEILKLRTEYRMSFGAGMAKAQGLPTTPVLEPEQLSALEQESDALWSDKEKKNNFKIINDSTPAMGLFYNFRLQLGKELMVAQGRLAEFQKKNEQLKKFKASCGSAADGATPPAQKAAPKAPSDVTGTETKSKAPAITGDTKGKDEPKSAGASTEPPPAPESRSSDDKSKDAPPSAGPTTADPEAPATRTPPTPYSETEGGGQRPPGRAGHVPYDINDPEAQGDPTYSRKPPRTTPAKDEPSWVSQNSGLLIAGGVGVAAVGGILYYKKQQDKEEKRKIDEEAWAYAMAQNAKSSSSSGSGTETVVITATGTQNAPQGSQLVINSGIPAGATVESNLTPIEISILDPSGVITQDSNTMVSVSCAVPFPCTIAGTLTVQSSVGKARFNDIRFTGPHTGVRLKFSAPGFTTVESNSSFNVTQ